MAKVFIDPVFGIFHDIVKIKGVIKTMINSLGKSRY
jgi:hypothetical protein